MLAFRLLRFVVFALGLSSFVVLAFLVFTCIDLGRIVRLPVISRVALIRVMKSLLLMHTLTICSRDMLRMRRRLFLGRRSSADSAGAVEADVIIGGRIVDHSTVNIGCERPTDSLSKPRYYSEVTLHLPPWKPDPK
jgi:hypothetical protein